MVEELKKFHEDYLKYQDEKNIKINEKNNLINTFERDKLKWNSDKQLREQRINFANEKLLMQSKVKDVEGQKTKNKNLLLTSIIIGIISILLMLGVHPVFIIGVIVAAVMGIISTKANKQKKTTEKNSNGDSINNLEQEFQNLRTENSKEDELIIEQTKDYESKILQISNTIAEIEKELEALTENSNNYQNSLNNCSEMKINNVNALNLVHMKQDSYVQERTYLLDKYSENSGLEGNAKISVLQIENLDEVTAIEYKNKIENLCNDLSTNIEEKMKEKSCLSLTEYKDKFLDYASDYRNRKAINEAEQEYSKKAEDFLSKVSEYEITQSYEDAKLLLEKLSEQVVKLEGEKLEVLNIAKGMGYSTPSLDYLIKEAANIEPSIDSMEEAEVNNYTEDELKKRYKELADLNIEDQLFELRKKIKTPDKNLSQIQEEIEGIEKEVKEKEQYFNCLKIAAEVMEEASDEMRQSFGPDLNKKTAEIFKSLTNGKYGNILVTMDYDISIQSGIHYREWKYLSNGTVDQAYLALRLAITELISDRNVALPLFLDDVMIQYDDERMDAALKFLSNYVKEKDEEIQLLLFTCHQNTIDNSKAYNTIVVNI